MKTVHVICLLIIAIQFSYAQNLSLDPSISSPNYLIQEASSSPVPILPEWNTRRITGLAYSTFVPGSGQFYLGHKFKGSLITLSFFASFVTAVVSHNNFISNKERLDNLIFDYYGADRYSFAEELWIQIKEVHDEQRTNERKRAISSYITAGIWVINIIDYLFLTDDLGVTEFADHLELNNSFVLADFQRIISIKIPL
jgi:TM2 domain-containing membrane protein YozV